jgi:hypothetical protein
VLIRTAIKLYANDATSIPDVHDLYALDSTAIDLCLRCFPGRGSASIPTN